MNCNKNFKNQRKKGRNVKGYTNKITCISTVNSCYYLITLIINYCHVITIYMSYCHVITFIYHKTHEIAAKVHASLLMATLNFLLFTNFIDFFMNIHETKSDMICVSEH